MIAWLGFSFTLIGASLLAFNKPQGWYAFLLANLFWSIFALSTANVPLLAQMGLLTITSIIGIRNAPRAAS